MTSRSSSLKEKAEIAVVDDLEKYEKDVLEALMALPDRSACRLIINSGGGSVYAGLGIATLIEMKQLRATGVVLADCSSAALLVFSSCTERLVSPHASFLFHPIQWSSDERSRLPGALGWAREFKRIEDVCCAWICERLGLPGKLYRSWVQREVYITAHELVKLGAAKYIPGFEPPEQVTLPVRRSGKRRATVVTSTRRRTRLAPAARR